MSVNRNDVPGLDSSELKEVKEKLIMACRILDHEGVTDGYGHISVRVPGADAFITISNVSPGCVTDDRLIMQDFAGNYLGGAKMANSCVHFKSASRCRERRAHTLEVEHNIQRAPNQA
ncbi:MAG: Class Aldolase and Adducin N-terminal domain [Deltaproteobacteria bacterium]|nr:Class Aldolase and Adducin N-terminal domain [Deltaproteobacteria bacterium]